MKKLLFFVVLGIYCSFSLNAQKYPVLEFDSYNYNLGTFARADAEKHVVFKYKNSGDADLVISKVSTGCPCTTANVSHKTLHPGESGELTVDYDGTKISAGKFRIEIILSSNTETKYTRLFLIGNLVNSLPQPVEKDTLSVRQEKRENVLKKWWKHWRKG